MCSFKDNKMYKKIFSALLFWFFLSGFATIISGDVDSVTFDSSPTAAEVYIDGAYVGMTPLTIRVEKNEKDSVMFKKDGYRTVTRDLSKSYDMVTMLSIFWDLSTTDFLTGAAFEYDPKSFYIELQKIN